jgi:hypothetical protein
MLRYTSISSFLAAATALTFQHSPYAYASDRTFEESCSSFASELDLPNVKVHLSQYLPKGYNLSISDFVS